MRATTGWSRALVGGYLVDVRWPDSGWGDAPVRPPRGLSLDAFMVAALAKEAWNVQQTST